MSAPGDRATTGGPPADASIFAKLNHWLYQVERAIVVVSLLVMSVVVFLSVVHRRYADPEGGGIVVTLALAAITYLGFRTASRRKLFNRGDESGKSPEELRGEPLSHLKCAIYTALAVGISYGLMVLLFGTNQIEQYECIELSNNDQWSFDCGLFPAGLAWAAPLGLILTLWVAFLGASMATKDNLHLKVEAVQHALPEKLQRISGLLSGIMTAIFCLVLAYLGYRYVGVKLEEYEISEGLGGLHDGIPIPYYVSFAVVPFAYVLMAIRFVGLGVLSLRGELEQTPAELRDLDLAKDDEGSSGGTSESEGGTVDSSDDGEEQGQ